MLITKHVLVKWNPTTRLYFENLGYMYSKHNDAFEIPIEHLPVSSNIKIELQCDYCEKKITRSYSTYNKLLNKSHSKKDACKKCIRLKALDEAQIKQSLGILSSVDRDYLIFKENRIFELNNFIKENKIIDRLYEKNFSLYHAINKYDGSIDVLTNELGYDWDDISSRSLNNRYKDFNYVHEKINAFIKDANRFPSQKEIIKKLKIQQRDIDFHGGMYEIKRKMNYDDVNDLVDSNGFLNLSYLEYQVAEYLIHNNVPYKREQNPFTEEYVNFRSDFTIETLNRKIFHVEVWGYSEKDKGSIAIEYNQKKRLKIGLYNKNNINLISIEYDMMFGKSFNKIQEYLSNCFSIIKDHKFKKVDSEFLVRPSALSDKNLLNVIMKYSEDDEILPSQAELERKGLGGVVREIIKRHETFNVFANKFNKTTKRKYTWDNENDVYERFLKIVNDKKPITKENLISYGYISYLNKKEGIGTLRLNFYEKYINNISYIHPKDLKFIENRLVKRSGRNDVPKEHKEQASYILEIYNSKNVPTTSTN